MIGVKSTVILILGLGSISKVFYGFLRILVSLIKSVKLISTIAKR